MILGLLIVSIPLMAHHGTGVSYDMKKVVAMKGVVTRFAFANPHSQLYFDVTDDKGNVTHWAAEMRAPGNLRGGLHKARLDGKVGAGEHRLQSPGIPPSPVRLCWSSQRQCSVTAIASATTTEESVTTRVQMTARDNRKRESIRHAKSFANYGA